jgi:integrase
VSVRRKKRTPLFEPEPLKTENAYRDVPLDPWLADDLRAYLLREHRDAPNPGAPLFPGVRFAKAAARAKASAEGQTSPTTSAQRFDWSRPIDVQNVYKRFWLPALDALGLPHSRWHDLRHSAAVSTLATEHMMCPGFGGVAVLGFRPRVGWIGAAIRTLSECAS